MKKILLSCLFLFILNIIKAHPGIGIVKDSKGNIYYTDLERVWKITPGGKRSVAVSGVHTHELYMDDSDRLFGEHLWYNGEQLDTWGHYVWCLENDGTLVKVIEPKSGFLVDYSFNRDGAGNMYWANLSITTQFKKKTRDGDISTIAEGKFSDVRWMHATNGGTVYFSNHTDIYKLENGQFILMAKQLGAQPGILENQPVKHSVFGIWLDKDDNVYVALASGQVVKRITQDKKVTDFIYSPGTWRPGGGLFDDSGNLWLMEIDAMNKVRVRKILKPHLSQPISASTAFLRNAKPLIVPAGIIISIGLSFFFITRKMLSKTQ